MDQQVTFRVPINNDTDKQQAAEWNKSTCFTASNCMLVACCETAVCRSWLCSLSINHCVSVPLLLSCVLGTSSSSSLPVCLLCPDIDCWWDALSNSDCRRSISACEQQIFKLTPPHCALIHSPKQETSLSQNSAIQCRDKYAISELEHITLQHKNS